MKLEYIKGGAAYFASPANVGAIVKNGKVLLVDSGNDTDKAKKIYRAIESEGLVLDGILNTHSHADHWGGNSYLQKKTGCRIRSSKIEAALINNNFMEPFYLYGAEPLKALRNKFLMAKECECEVLEGNEIDFMGECIGIEDLRGHSPGMVGYKTSDGVFYIGDALFSSEIIDKYKLLFTSDVTGQLRTLEYLEKCDSEFYVMGHGSICEAERLEHLVGRNRDAIERVCGILMDGMKTPCSLEELMDFSMTRLGAAMNVGQYFLNRTTVSAYLSHLCNEGEASAAMECNRLVYSKK